MIFIESELHTKITLDVLSKKSGYSKRHLQKIFKDYMGVSVGSYILNRKMINSADLILNTNMGISEISVKFGYFESSVFSRAFSKHYGKSPTKFRAIYKEY
ncbi:helix-turn-helix transcriptional regulator [Klebsiella sp. T2.Ur]|nr:helix-turn-helix transcriptional regulator [Klebsiella sp. T2.Ur]MCL6723076.1 helix-turn-helix transcriptional regulator [Klebsiella sp. T2.Ur]